MSAESWYKKPSSYVAAGGAVLLASLAMCSGKKTDKDEISLKPKQVHTETYEDTGLQAEVDPFEKALREVLSKANEEPRVSLTDRPASLYKMEEALAECIQAADNTCYLSYEYSLMFRTRLECYSNTWRKFSSPVLFAVRPDAEVGGVNINMRLPNGGYTSYESAPSVESNPEEAEEFYTQICRDALEVLSQEPDQTPCDYPQDYGECKKMEDNEEWAATLGDELQFGYEALESEGFQVELTDANTLRTTFENSDGSTEAETLFPKREHCEDEEGSYNGEPCWKFKLMSGGEYDASEVLDYAVNKQLRLLEE